MHVNNELSNPPSLPSRKNFLRRIWNRLNEPTIADLPGRRLAKSGFEVIEKTVNGVPTLLLKCPCGKEHQVS